jgi:DNA-binding beta-propeller fold protein YncE
MGARQRRQETAMKHVTMMAAVIGVLIPAASWAANPPLVLEAKIPLGAVAGRIDHFAFDPDRQLLFVAELGNDSVGVVDLKERSVMHRLAGLSEPQGLAWHVATSMLYVANAGDGSVRLYQGRDFTPAGRVELGDDADNIRIDSRRNRIVVGYGKGALAAIDPASRKKVADMPLKGHPESFQFNASGSRIFANVPDARQIAVVDADRGQQISTLDTAGASSNFPMAVDADEHRLLVVFRSPARLMVYATRTGKLEGSFDMCRDADDVFVDPQRRRLYVSCGEGVIDVLAQASDGYERVARIPTIAGARTSLFVPATDRLYLGVRATATEPAAIWVFRPRP